PFRTIQKGVQTAQNGDTILVANGTYTGAANTNLNFGGKHFTLQSLGGAANCIIDCAGFGPRGFAFSSGETEQMVVDGFTVKNGSVGGLLSNPEGAAVTVSSARPTLRNCIFRDNTAQGLLTFATGGAVYISDASPTFTNCSFINNQATSTDHEAY